MSAQLIHYKTYKNQSVKLNKQDIFRINLRGEDSKEKHQLNTFHGQGSQLFFAFS